MPASCARWLSACHEAEHLVGERKRKESSRGPLTPPRIMARAPICDGFPFAI
jgi:hypothetical protein